MACVHLVLMLRHMSSNGNTISNCMRFPQGWLCTRVALVQRVLWVQGYMCAAATPCLDDSGRCTSKCVPLAASFCAGICPNALQYVPGDGPGAQQGASSPAQQPLGGSALLQALGAQPGPSEVGHACSGWRACNCLCRLLMFLNGPQRNVRALELQHA